MSYIDQISTATETVVTQIVADATRPISEALTTATTNLAAARAQVTALQSKGEATAAQVAALQAEIVTLNARIEELTTAPGVEPSDGLAFKLTAGPFEKKVFAHYFGPYPRRTSNVTRDKDGWGGTWLNVDHPAYAKYGGWHSNRPIEVPVEPAGVDFRYKDAVFDIQTAQAHGIDGFACDMLGLSGSNYDNYARLVKAASDLDTGFYVVPMVDANGATGLASPADAARAIATFAGRKSSFYLPDGRFVISSFAGERKNLHWWAGVVSALKTSHNIDAALLLSFLNFGAGDALKSITMGEGSWGGGDDPAWIKRATDQAAISHAKGKVYMAPVGGSQTRRTSSKYDESANTEALRAGWEKAIEDAADYVQIVTWSDYSEGTTHAPSEAHGYGMLIVDAWYAEKFHTGSYPTILRDEVLLSYRSNLVGSGHSLASQTVEMVQWPRGGALTTPRDTVEVLTFLTAPSTVTVTIGGQQHVYTAPAGMNAQLFPLLVGSPPSVTTDRGVTVTGVVPVVELPVRDDKQYFMFSALQGTAGQRAPIGP